MIIGLTDRPAAPPQLGTLRKGAPKPQNGNKPGADLEYFRFDSDDADAIKFFNEIYGPEPRAIRVFVPFARTDENFDAWREAWTASSLQHRCDGQTMVRWLTARGTYSDEPKPCAGGCKQVGRLKVIIPELKRFAVVTVLTTSVHDIIQIHSNLLALESARGSLTGIPLILKRSPREISTPSGSNGQRARREKWLISIEAQPQWVELQLTAQERAALPTPEPLALPEWDGEDEEETTSTPANVSDGRVTRETLDAIEKLWGWHGIKRGAGIEPFADYIHRKKQLNHPTVMLQADALKMLEWLQQKALAVEAPLLTEEPKADKGSGLDQWKCTQETQSRQLAMDVLNLTKRLEASGVTETEWRAELNDMFPHFELPVSRKSLGAEEIRESWLPLIEGWAKRNEAKKGASA